MGPEDIATELDRLARIFITEGRDDERYGLPKHERDQYHYRLEDLLSGTMNRAVVLCIMQQTREFLAGYIEGVPRYDHIRRMLADA